MLAARKCWLSVGLLLGGVASLARAAILPTDFEATVSAEYEPADSDERALWLSLERLEAGVRNSPQRLIAPELDAYIRGLVERLIHRPAPELRIYLLRDASLNAAILPSGMMIVNTGLLARVRDEAQLVAVLAHEAGHYFRRHALDLYRAERRKESLGFSKAATVRSGDDLYGMWAMINQAVMLSSMRFSRDLESEADAYGLMLMARAGYRPHAAVEMWQQYVAERRASAAARNRRYRDGTNSALSSHPPTQRRMINLADTAAYLAGKHGLQSGPAHDGWAEVIRPHQAMLLREQTYLNDAGASLYLLEHQARNGWTGLLRFNEGEVYRLRNARGDDERAARAYAAATAMADAPPEAWREHGYALLRSGSEAEAREALTRYLAMNPRAADAPLVRSALSRRETDNEPVVAAGRVTLSPESQWQRLYANTNVTRWDEVWTWSGAQIDRMTLVDGLPEGKAIVIQDRTTDQQVPVFRADMTAQDLASMLEVSYRVRGVTAFDLESVEPVEFLAGPGVSLRYDYASGIVFHKKGRCVMRIVGQKLYAMKLEGLATESFDALAARFDRLVAGARLSR